MVLCGASLQKVSHFEGYADTIWNQGLHVSARRYEFGRRFVDVEKISGCWAGLQATYATTVHNMPKLYKTVAAPSPMLELLSLPRYITNHKD